MRRKLVVFGSLSVVLLASAGTLTVPDRRVPPPSAVRKDPPAEANRRRQIVAALQDGFPPALVRDLDDLVRDGEIPTDLVIRAKAEANKNHAQSLLSEIRSGTRDPRSEDPVIRAALKSGLITKEAITAAWREGSEKRARALVDRLCAPMTPRSALHEFDPASVPEEIEATLEDAGWSVDEIADARKVWKDRQASRTLALLYYVIYVPNWLDHLEWGLDRGVFSSDRVNKMLMAADRKEYEQFVTAGVPENDLETSVGRRADSWRQSQALRVHAARTDPGSDL